MKPMKYQLMETALRMPAVKTSETKPEKDMSRLYDLMVNYKP